MSLGGRPVPARRLGNSLRWEDRAMPFVLTVPLIPDLDLPCF